MQDLQTLQLAKFSPRLIGATLVIWRADVCSFFMITMARESRAQ
eukprot:UN03288